MFFAPFVLGVAVVGLMWRYMLDTNFGILNALLGLFGVPDESPWTTDQPWAWVALVGMTVWWTLGFNAVIYLAGLQDIPAEQYEAAAGGRRRTAGSSSDTSPCRGCGRCSPFVVTITILASANMFGQSVLVTQGGPGDETATAMMVDRRPGAARSSRWAGDRDELRAHPLPDDRLADQLPRLRLRRER